MQRQRGVLVNLSPPLPQELIGEIIDCLHDDHASLRVCALVARAWAYCAQSNLFRTRLLTNSEDLKRSEEWFNRNPHLAVHVRTLRINLAHEHYEWIGSVPRCLLTRLPLLQALHFERVEWTTKAKNTMDISFFASLAECKALRELSLDKCKFATFRDLERMVCVCGDGRLKKLSLDLVTWQDKQSTNLLEQQQLTKQLSGLTHVNIGRNCSIEFMCNWLRQTPACPTLHSVEIIDITQKNELKAVSELLRTVGHSLEHLKLSCLPTLVETAEAFIQSIPQHLDLTPLTGLRSLHIVLTDLEDDFLRWVPLVLDKMRAPLLKRLKFDVWVKRSHRLDGKAWKALVKWITGLKGVREILFVQRGFARVEEAKFWLETGGLAGLGEVLRYEERRIGLEGR
ncbi:hypothetical protein BC835DRAFT_559586 [Cytidiella melzeri]|nr:hypothetical protein BC835DRAFT_559586 [Cytidiella melzeri]